MRNALVMSISSFVLLASGVAHAADAGADASADAATDASSDAATEATDAASDAAADSDAESCGDPVASCTGGAVGDACAIDDASTGVCTSVPCGGGTVLACEPALGALIPDASTTIATDASADASTTTTTTTCAPHAAECAGHQIGDGCDTSDGNSSNCGEVTCGGVTVLTCVEGKGSAAGGCDIGSADLTTTVALFGLLAPFAALRRRRSQKAAKKAGDTAKP